MRRAVFGGGGGCRKRGRGERSKKRLVRFFRTDMKDEKRGRVERKMYMKREVQYIEDGRRYRVRGHDTIRKSRSERALAKKT